MKKITLLFVYYLLFSKLIFSQILGNSGISNSLNLAQGNTYNASSRGVYASGINPANLVYNLNNTFELSSIVFPFNISVSTGNNVLSIDKAIKYFTPIDSNGTLKPKIISQRDISDFKNYFSNDLNIYNSINFNWFSIYYKYTNIFPSFAFSIDENISNNLTIPKDLPTALVDLSFSNENIYLNLSNLNVQSWWIRSYTLSLGYSLNNLFKSEIKSLGIDEINFGVGIKYISGFAYSGFSNNRIFINNIFDTSNSKYEYNFYAKNISYVALSDNFGPVYDYNKIEIKSHIPKQFYPTEAGRGFGYDFAITSRLNYHLFSFAITDIGNIKWFKNTAKYTLEGSFKFSGLGNGNFNEIKDSLQRTLDTLDKFLPNGSFRTKLPTAIRLGYAVQVDKIIDDFPGIMNFAMDLNFGLNNMPNNSKTPRFSAGINWNISENLPYIRTGVSFGGKYGFIWSLGTGLELNWYSLDISTVNIHEFLKKNQASKLLFAISSRIRF